MHIEKYTFDLLCYQAKMFDSRSGVIDQMNAPGEDFMKIRC